MAERNNREDLPQAIVAPERRSRISVVWVLPIITALIAVGIAVHQIMSEGPTISIVFKDAQGIEAGKTVVKYKDVTIGQVSAVQLSDDHSKVVVTAQMNRDAADLMVADAKFWVVQPRITLSGISGLGTLISGNYIGFEPGSSRAREHHFTGLEEPPVITIEQPGREFRLTADDLGSLGVGSPVYFRRIEVGKIIAYDLAPNGKTVALRVFINAPYDRFVVADTRFWNASGLDVSVGADGVDVRTESLVSFLIGGLAFDTPPDAPGGRPAASDTVFELYKDRQTAMKQPEAVARRYLLYFDDSLRGLSVGAPLTLLGLTAGEVTDVGFDVTPKDLELRGRVEIVAYPERLIARLHQGQAATVESLVQSEQRSHAVLQRLVEEHGLRAQLRSGSLITGQRYVALDFFPDAPMARVDWSAETPVMPTVPSTLPDLETKVTDILAKLDRFPFEAIGSEVRQTLKSLDRTLDDLDEAVRHIDTGVVPELKPAVAELRKALVSADRVLSDADATLVGEGAPAQQDLSAALREVARAARSIRVLADYLERQPEALLRGKPGPGR